MAKIEFIGNLGSDAQVQEQNGQKFVTFNVADTQRYTDANGVLHESTQWISCVLNGDGGRLLQHLVKGKTVFVRGAMSTRVFNSAKHHCMMAGVNCNVREIELVGGSTRSVPRQLNDSNGVLFDIYEAFYIDPSIADKPTVLYDARMQRYDVDNLGYVRKVESSGDSSTGSSAPAATNDEVF